MNPLFLAAPREQSQSADRTIGVHGLTSTQTPDPSFPQAQKTTKARPRPSDIGTSNGGSARCCRSRSAGHMCRSTAVRRAAMSSESHPCPSRRTISHTHAMSRSACAVCPLKTPAKGVVHRDREAHRPPPRWKTPQKGTGGRSACRNGLRQGPVRLLRRLHRPDHVHLVDLGPGEIPLS